MNKLWKKILQNYQSWCSYLHVSSSIMYVQQFMKILLISLLNILQYLMSSNTIILFSGIRNVETVTQNKQQLMLLHIGLYLLIWGEASNVRFMPECLCYIFHHVSIGLNGRVFHARFHLLL